MTDEGDMARALEHRDLIVELGDIKSILARLERLMTQIALSLGLKPEA